jgi:hypothetical protein
LPTFKPNLISAESGREVHSNGSLRKRQEIWGAKTNAAPSESPSVEFSYLLSQQAADFGGEIVHNKELGDHVHARRHEIACSYVT